MTVIIEVVSSEIKLRQGTSKHSGRPYSLREQEAYLHKKGGAYPDKIKLTLEDNQPPYLPGNYDLLPESFFPDRFGSLSVKPRLVARAGEIRQK